MKIKVEQKEPSLLDVLCNMLTAAFLGLSSADSKGTDALMEFWKEFVAKAMNLIPNDKPYGTALFDALNKKQPTFAFEGVLLRINPETNQLEVYMTQRSMTETAYPGEYHCPGSGIRNGENWNAVAARVARNEFKVGIKSLVILYGKELWYQEARGFYCSQPCLVELEGEPAVGKWYPVDNLPEKTVEHHRDYIIPAVVSFWRSREKQRLMSEDRSM